MAARGQGSKYQGSKWITRERRLAIYIRDGLACAYCGIGIEDGAQLSLDHLTPHCEGGKNTSDNLVTCCKKCNSSRGARSVGAFCIAVAIYLNHGILASQILAHVQSCVARPVDIKAAKALIAARGSFTQALHH